MKNIKTFESFIDDQGNIKDFNHKTYIIISKKHINNLYLSQLDPPRFTGESSAMRKTYHFPSLDDALEYKSKHPKRNKHWSIHEYDPTKTISMGNTVG